MSRKLWSILCLLLVFSLALAACGGDGEEPATESSETGAETGGEEEMEEGEEVSLEDVQGGNNILEMADNGAFSGTTVSVFGAFVDEDQRRFDTSMAPFEERTGIDVQYEGSGDFETLIQVRVDGGDPPDIGAHPQPGLLRGLVDQGAVIDPTTFLGQDFMEAQYDDGWLADAVLSGQPAGIWYRANVKSLTWYPKAEFVDAGYTIPESWDELIALSDQIVEDGVHPWCIGIESSGATGWVATDWMEDIMLRTQPPEVYDQWTTGELPFDSPEVKNAAQVLGEIWFNEDYVLGGTTGILTTPFGDAPTPMFDEPPSCYLHRQASFIPAFFPDDVEVGTDVDFFYFPMIEEEYGEPVLTAGDIFAMYNDRPEVRAVMAYLSTGESTKAWVEAGGFVSPHKDANLDWYSTDIDRRFAEMLQDATTTRFDGSDLMPAAVGAGSFWTGMVDYANGQDLDAVMQQIDSTWPEE